MTSRSTKEKEKRHERREEPDARKKREEGLERQTTLLGAIGTRKKQEKERQVDASRETSPVLLACS